MPNKKRTYPYPEEFAPKIGDQTLLDRIIFCNKRHDGDWMEDRHVDPIIEASVLHTMGTVTEEEFQRELQLMEQTYPELRELWKDPSEWELRSRRK